jgi:hypothetical protein
MTHLNYIGLLFLFHCNPPLKRLAIFQLYSAHNNNSLFISKCSSLISLQGEGHVYNISKVGLIKHRNNFTFNVKACSYHYPMAESAHCVYIYIYIYIYAQGTARCHIPENRTLHNHRCENLSSAFWDMTPSLWSQPTFRRNMPLTSSGSMIKPSTIATCFMLVSCLAYSTTLRMVETWSSET